MGGPIATASYKAREFGVRSAMPGFVAKQLCPQLKFVPSNFKLYSRCGAQVRAIFAQFDPDFSSHSLDEATLALDGFCERNSVTPEVRWRWW